MKDLHGMVLSRDICSEDCINLHSLANQYIVDDVPLGYFIRSAADRYRQLLTLLYEQGYEPFDAAHTKDVP